MKKRLATSMAALLSAQVSAEPALNYAELFSHPSQTLNETRHYSVHLPRSYQQSPNKHYPVLYLLDGENRMLQVSGIANSFQGGLSAEVPELIIVGIHNTDRMRDYTPTHYEKLPSGEDVAWYKNTGGGKQFLNYLTTELMPVIDHDYRTTNPNLLVGHSLGGLISLDALSQHETYFQGVISIDPSLWFDYPNYYKTLKSKLNKPFTTPAALYLAIANNPFTPGLGRDNFHRDNLKRFSQDVAPSANSQLQFKSEYYPQQDHHTVYHLAVYQGLKWLFDGYALDSAPEKLQLESIKENYQRLNQRFNSQLKPDASALDSLAKKGERWPLMQISPKEIQRIKAYFYPSSEQQ
ncbi:alpha/beta hydrolase [Vibrio olivae]|uniref:Alpha/beta hydrolase n=1 Tax=Vibrio olivae TaxID=1243002 RepID=A0ABV5HSV5_9VIBR